MKLLLPVLFALTAAIGNALFALGQQQSATVANGLAFVSCAAFVAALLAVLSAPLLGQTGYAAVLREHWLPVMLSGVGLYLTYLGFNLLYARYGASYYVIYAVLSIFTTALVIGIVWFRETFNLYHGMALACAVATVVLFSLGQAAAK